MSHLTRREFLKGAAAAAGAWAGSKAIGAPAITTTSAPGNRLNIACIGAGGQGGTHIPWSAGENLVALCDVDENHLGSGLKKAEQIYRDRKLKNPLPKTFTDYREMFDKMHKEIDAVTVGIPDNHHAPASMMAIKLGKHVYCEKPLTHDIHEARALAEAARRYKVATQMGNQGRAEEGWRLLCEFIWAGAIGNVKEVHVWTDRPGIPSHFWWPQGAGRPPGSDPVPENLHWDLWLGPAPDRPYLGKYKDGKFKDKSVYHPFVWRGWWDFGTGALGDIGCHAMSGTFTALKIAHAAGVELVKDSGTTAEMFPENSIICWSIPERPNAPFAALPGGGSDAPAPAAEKLPPCKIFWYDGANYPSREISELPEGKELPVGGTIVVGDKGKLSWYGGGPRLMPEEKMKDFKKPDPVIPRCETDHHREWIAACKGGRPAFSNFDHAGPLAEMVLLGNLALRAGLGKKVQWDGANMKVTNLPELNQYVRREYRKGWTL